MHSSILAAVSLSPHQVCCCPTFRNLFWFDLDPFVPCFVRDVVGNRGLW